MKERTQKKLCLDCKHALAMVFFAMCVDNCKLVQCY